MGQRFVTCSQKIESFILKPFIGPPQKNLIVFKHTVIPTYADLAGHEFNLLNSYHRLISSITTFATLVVIIKVKSQGAIVELILCVQLNIFTRITPNICSVSIDAELIFPAQFVILLFFSSSHYHGYYAYKTCYFEQIEMKTKLTMFHKGS